MITTTKIGRYRLSSGWISCWHGGKAKKVHFCTMNRQNEHLLYFFSERLRGAEITAALKMVLETEDPALPPPPTKGTALPPPATYTRNGALRRPIGN